MGDGPTTDREAGATLVEFALVLPLLLLLVIGILELGMAFRSSITVGSAASEGARVASFKGDDLDADCHAIEAAMSLLGGELDEVDFFQIFEVDTDGDPRPTPTSTTGSGTSTTAPSGRPRPPSSRGTRPTAR